MYKYNSISTTPPPGSIMSYLGTTDPDGWVICDGRSISATDNRYSILAGILNTAFGITTNNSNYISTPNLKNLFICGRSDSSSGQSFTGGNSNVSLTVSNLPSHNHSIPDHKHQYIDACYMEINGHKPNGSHYGTEGSDNDNGFYYRGSDGRLYSTPQNLDTTTVSSQTTNNTGSNSSFSILPPYMTMNYIIKY